MQIRDERDEDRTSIQAVIKAAFERGVEANLVDALRDQAHPVISLVAEDGGVIVGHIMFSPVVLAGHSKLNIMGLAPMAVSQTINVKASAPRWCALASRSAKNSALGLSLCWVIPTSTRDSVSPQLCVLA